MKIKDLFSVVTLMFVTVACSPEKHHNVIAPLPSGIDLKTMTDATVPASCSLADFDWEDSTLTLTIYSEDLYDAVEVSTLCLGDTIVFDGQHLIIDSLAHIGSFVVINGGVESGGAELCASEQGGTYRALGMDDYSYYTPEGSITLPLDSDFVIAYCGKLYTDPYDTIRTSQREYLEHLPDYMHTFPPELLRVRIEGGRVKYFTRLWVP